jgi:nucleoside-diphosphate-sugar epimerase
MTILITGGTGFVGAHMVASLGRRFPGTPLVVGDLAAPPDEVASFWGDLPVSFRALDASDRAAVQALVTETAPRYVVHAAAITPSAAREAADPLGIVDVNLGGTLSVLDAATRSPGIARVLLCSSAAVYGFGLPDMATVPETAPLVATGLYGMTKLACESLGRRFGELRGVSTVAVRISACYGTMERPTGHRQRMSQVHALFCALAAGRPITAVRSAALRDWTDADDVGDAIAALLATPHLNHAVYNVGFGQALRWSDVLTLFARHGLDVRVADAGLAEASFDEALGRAPLAIDRLVADTGYVPHRTLEQSILRVLADRKAMS